MPKKHKPRMEMRLMLDVLITVASSNKSSVRNIMHVRSNAASTW